MKTGKGAEDIFRGLDDLDFFSTREVPDPGLDVVDLLSDDSSEKYGDAIQELVFSEDDLFDPEKDNIDDLSRM